MNIIPKRKPVTAKSAVRKAAFNTVVGTALAGAALMFMSMAGTTATVIDDANDGNYGRPNAAGSPADLMEKHKCWSGEAPADMQGVIPGHVVIRYDGEVAAKYRGADAVGVALAHIFEESNPRVAEVVGFCR